MPLRVEDQQLKAFLKDSGILALSEKQLEVKEKKARKEGKRLGDILLAEGALSEEDLVKTEAYILGIPFVNLEKMKVPHEVLRIIPEPIARRNNIVAFRKVGDALEVAMLDPEDLQTIDFIRKKVRLRILPRLTTSASIKILLKQYTKSLQAEFGELIKGDVETITAAAQATGVEAEGLGEEDLRKSAEELPIVRIVDTLVKHAILQNASDIHIEPMERELVVRYRIDGILHDAMTLPRQVVSGIVARIKVLARLKLDEHRLPQDGRFTIRTEDYRYSFRVSILPVYDGEKIVIRLLPEGVEGYTLDGLGFRGRDLEVTHRALKRPVGMILVTGPTGSGKTTTLYAMMEILNTPGVNISTVEDPIEYRMPRINQTQIRPDIGLTFANGLRALVRQDPDIIMVGEIRDSETASLAVNAALTGHLVLSTLHTNSAAAAIPRLIDMGVEPFLLSSTIQFIIAQRLVRRLCSERETYHIPEKEIITAIGEDVDTERLLALLREDKAVPPDAKWKDIEFSKPKTSSECPEGYRGRIGIYEVLNASESIKELTNQRASSDVIHQQALKEGMRTMFEDGFLKAARKETSIEEVLRVVAE